MGANKTEAMLGFEDAVFKAFEMATVEVLLDPNKFISYVTDLCDHSEKPYLVFVHNCNDELLAPLVEVSHEGDATAIKMAASKCLYTLTERRGLDKTRAQECVDGLAGALARTRGVAYEPLGGSATTKSPSFASVSNVLPEQRGQDVPLGGMPTQVRASVQAQSQGPSPYGAQAQPIPVVQQAQYNQPVQSNYVQPAQANYAQPAPAKKSRAGLIIGIAALACIATVAVVVFIVMGKGQAASSSNSATGAGAGASSAGEQTTFQDGSDAAGQDSAGQDSAGQDSAGQDSAGQDSVGQGGLPTAKTSLRDYTWSELSQIGQRIAECSSKSDALTIAEEYNLVGPGGEFSSSTKPLQLNDGSTIDVKIVDVWHDEANTSSGLAGITFLATLSVDRHPMNDGKYNNGGWEMSSMRSWLSTTVANKLPDDLRNAIVPVYKWSNNVGKASSGDCVTSTLDEVWIPSIVELAGEVNWEYHTDPTNAPLYNSVFNAEGYQYAAFEQAGVDDAGNNAILAIPGGNWWLRSTAASTGRGRYVTDGGDPSGFGDASSSWQVVIGFCL